MPYERELEAALEACRRAQERILPEYAQFQPILDAHADIKLSIDRESQELILQHLDAVFPEDSFCAEEDTPTLTRTQATPRDRERIWIIDPIDGTRGFARKNGEFSVMVALVEKGEVVVGVVQEPARDQLTYAVRSGGCWQRRGTAAAAPCRVTATAQLAEATLTQSRSSASGRSSPFVEALKPARIVSVYSAGIKLALVARGEADLYLNTYPNFHDWDIAAGHILVTEAGGQVTSRFGRPLEYGQPGAPQRHGLLASNGLLHLAALQALRATST